GVLSGAVAGRWAWVGVVALRSTGRAAGAVWVGGALCWVRVPRLPALAPPAPRASARAGASAIAPASVSVNRECLDRSTANPPANGFPLYRHSPAGLRPENYGTVML